ncbi:ALK and LTK ligand 2 isoform X1 [Monodon monoceros]|uniref:ALK and LTK ligand 2 isoform X1 n=1 Tax=Monodon monoceros TaxID=40151 RepID=UPI0010F8F688|nr:ALK and LTK ligand 2 isoform X1 [Monodon monoceros]
MRGPGRPLLLGLLLVLGAAGPGRGVAETREAADRQTLLQLIVEIVQELRKYHSGESKRLQLSGRQDYTLGRREVSDYGAYPEEQRVEIVPRDLRMKDKFLKHLTGRLSTHSLAAPQLLAARSPHNLFLLPRSRSSLFQPKVQQTLPQALPQHPRLHHPHL